VPLRPITTPGANVPQLPPQRLGVVSSHHPLMERRPPMPEVPAANDTFTFPDRLVVVIESEG